MAHNMSPLKEVVFDAKEKSSLPALSVPKGSKNHLANSIPILSNE